MKTQSNQKDLYSTIRLPEIIVWIISILIFTSIIYGFNLNAQTLDEYKQDTIWLKTGMVIPCKLSENAGDSKVISYTYRNEKGDLVFDQIPYKKIERFQRDHIAEDTTLILYRIELKGGTILTGNIMTETETHYSFYVADVGLIKINKNQVKKTVPLNAPKEMRKSFWFENPHATRLLFAPTAIPLRQGEGYYQNIYVYINMFNVGVLNNLSIGAGFDIITMFMRRDGEWNPMLNFNIKSGFKIVDNFHLAAGGLYITLPGEFSTGILYGLGTFGSHNTNISLGAGWGFVDGTFEERPFIMLGGMARISERLWFVSENWFLPINSNSYDFLISYGCRIASPRVAVDIAFINNEDIFNNFLVIGIPYVDVVIKFGKRK